MAFNHSGREGSARSEECVILDISDADEAWETLRDAIAGFMTVPAAQQFGLAAERLRTLRFDLIRSRARLRGLEGKVCPTYLVPTTARGLLEILRQPSHPDRAAVIDLIEHPPNGITSTVLNRVIQNVAVLRAVVNYNVTADRLRQTWVNVELEPNSVPASLRRRLANALSITGREPSAAEVDQIHDCRCHRTVAVCRCSRRRWESRTVGNHASVSRRLTRPLITKHVCAFRVYRRRFRWYAIP